MGWRDRLTQTYLTGYKTTRLGDEKGDGELGNNEENERELKALHGSCPDGSEGKSEILVREK